MVTAWLTGVTRKSSPHEQSNWRKVGDREKCFHRRTARLACLHLKESDLPAAAGSGIQRDRDREPAPGIGDRRDETVSKPGGASYTSPQSLDNRQNVRDSCDSSLRIRGV